MICLLMLIADYVFFCLPTPGKLIEADQEKIQLAIQIPYKV